MQRSASYNWDDICFMDKRGSPGRPTARSATPEDQAEAQRLTALLEAAAKTASYDHNPQLWDEVLTALNLDICYQVTVAEVLRRETWRTAANPRAYVATAAVRSARGKQLPDYFEREFRRVDSDEPDSDVGTHRDSGADFDLEEWGGGGVYERTASGGLRYVDSHDGDYRQIPAWLQRDDEYGAVDWETVAAYAVLKPRMACHLARVLIARFDLRLGRPETMARAKSDQDASAIEATWKWIDRNAKERIAPLFRTVTPPRPLTAEDIASFPMLAPGVSLRLDIEPRWDRRKKQLILARDGVIDIIGVEAASQKAAMETVREIAPDWEDSEIFHYWPLAVEASAVEAPPSPAPGEFAKPWEVLSRVSNGRPRRH